MLTAEEISEIEAEAAHYPKREAVCIDALKIVQRRRGWVSDESLRDIAAHLGMSPTDLDSVATFYNLIFRRPVRPPRDHGLRQRELLDHGPRPYPQASQRAPGDRVWRDHCRRSLHAAADRLSGVLRSCSGHDGGRRSAQRSRSPENRCRSSRNTNDRDHRKATDARHAPR